MTEGRSRERERDRIDRALLRDAAHAARSPAVWVFALVTAAAVAIQILRGGPERIGLVATIALGVTAFSVLAWFAGRHDGAVQEPGRVRWPVGEGIGILVAYSGLVLWLAGRGAVGGPLFLAGVAGWIAAAALARYRLADFAWVGRSPVPFLALLLAILIPKLVVQGPVALALAMPAALFSGIFQQVLLQEGVVARFEAIARRTDVAAVLGAAAFAVAHAPMNLGQAQGDHLLALAATFVYQGPIGLVFILGYLRHRAAVPLGVIHGVAIA